MATLQFKGKNIIWNHHMSVPYHTLDLDEKLSYKQDKAEGNLIVEGDNLPALKSLLPQYTGKIDCIYIDPPYNTGNEGWVYNDNVNSPLVKEWIGKEVGSDDLTRHDKWLSLMAPRLKIIKELLSEDGLLCVSIDDNEIHRLRSLLDEIFGEDCFYGNITWIKKSKPTNMGEARFKIQSNVEYILIYGRKTMTEHDRFNLEVDEEKDYPLKDEKGVYRLEEVVQRRNRGTLRRDTMLYPLLGEEPKEGYRWQLSEMKYKKLNKDDLIIKKGNKFYIKSYKEEEDSFSYIPLWSHFSDTGTAESGKKDLEKLLGEEVLFETVKPVDLILRLLYHFADKNGFVLDAFAGSGTTAQAVLELNEADEGNRKFILIQMPENSEKEPKKNIARDITRERVVKVIEKKLKNNDIGFEYRRVGQPIDAETILSGQLPTYKQLAKYVYYLATGQSPKEKDIDEKKFLAGKVDHTEVYLLYTPDMEELKKMAITFEWAKEISEGNENKKIVYAPACFMDDEYLEQFNIKFVSIPYNLFEREK